MPAYLKITCLGQSRDDAGMGRHTGVFFWFSISVICHGDH